MTRIKNLKGFTLIELIVVIVIIGILAAVAAVAYNSFIANSKVAAAKAEYTQIAKLVQAESAFKQVDPSAVVVANFGGDLPNGVLAADVTFAGNVLEVANMGSSTMDCTGLTFGDNAGVSPTGTAVCAG